jgi:hypothetical protein
MGRGPALDLSNSFVFSGERTESLPFHRIISPFSQLFSEQADENQNLHLNAVITQLLVVLD